MNPLIATLIASSVIGAHDPRPVVIDRPKKRASKAKRKKRKAVKAARKAQR